VVQKLAAAKAANRERTETSAARTRITAAQKMSVEDLRPRGPGWTVRKALNPAERALLYVVAHTRRRRPDLAVEYIPRLRLRIGAASLASEGFYRFPAYGRNRKQRTKPIQRFVEKL
jgi:hypothetical protein